jgi:hypothetical protein
MNPGAKPENKLRDVPPRITRERVPRHTRDHAHTPTQDLAPCQPSAIPTCPLSGPPLPPLQIGRVPFSALFVGSASGLNKLHACHPILDRR